MKRNRLDAYGGLGQRTKRAIASAAPFVRPYAYNLTVSHSHRLVWFRVAKVGTRTILYELQRGGVELDTRHARLQRYPHRRLEGYLLAAFVRNPWDRLVSAWQNKVVDSNLFGFDERELPRLRDFGAFVDHLATLDIDLTDIHVRPQSRLIDYENLDFLGRLETFEEDLRGLLGRLGVEHEGFVRKNASARTRHYRELYDARTRDLVGELYRDDVENFDYRF